MIKNFVGLLADVSHPDDPVDLGIVVSQDDSFVPSLLEIYVFSEGGSIISTEERVLRSFLPDKEIDSLDAGVRTLLKGLLGLFAPFAIAFSLP